MIFVTHRASSIELDECHLLFRVHTPDVLINVRGLLAAEIAVRTLVPRCLATLVSVVAEHGIPSTIAVVAIRTVVLARVRVVLYVPLLHILLPTHKLVKLD